MEKEFSIPYPKKWAAIFTVGGMLGSIVPILKLVEFFQAPSWAIFAEFAIFLLLVCIVFRDAYNYSTTVRRIRLAGDEVFISETKRTRAPSWQAVRTFDDDQVAFHLYSEACSLTLPKHQIPSDLHEELESRIND